MSAYVRKLQAMIPNQPTEAQNPQPQDSLRDRLQKWLNNLPAPTRNRPFSMQEFETALGAPGRLIAPVLVELGWQRKRQWTGREHYHRFWVPSEQG